MKLQSIKTGIHNYFNFFNDPKNKNRTGMKILVGTSYALLILSGAAAIGVGAFFAYKHFKHIKPNENKTTEKLNDTSIPTIFNTPKKMSPTPPFQQSKETPIPAALEIPRETTKASQLLERLETSEEFPRLIHPKLQPMRPRKIYQPHLKPATRING